jgi:hypothetical protein
MTLGTGATNLQSGGFVGLGNAVDATHEGQVLVPLSKSGTFTSLFCFVQNPAGAAGATFTLREGTALANMTNQPLICTVSAGSNTCSVTGSVPFSAGNLIDILSSSNLGFATCSLGIQ